MSEAGEGHVRPDMVAGRPGMADRLARHTMGFGIGYFFLCNLGGPAVHYAVAPGIPYWSDPIVLLSHTLGLAAAAAFLLARDGHSRLAARLLVGAAFIIVWAAVLVTTRTAYATWIPFYLAIPPLIGGFILPAREVIGVGVLNVLGAFAMGLWGPIPIATAVNAAVLAAAVTLVMGVNAGVRRGDEATIHHQAGQLAAHTAELERLVVASSDALISIDPAGGMRLWNHAATGFMAPRARPADGAPLRVLLEPGLGEVVAGLVEDAGEDAAPASDEVALPDGRVVMATVAPIRGRGHLVTLRDVTDAKEAAKEEQERYLQQVEIDKLREVNRFKTNLLNTASHELNTPLTPIRLQLELLRSAERGPLTPKQLHSLDILERNARRLAELVQDILDVARMESDRLRIQQGPVAIGTLVRDQIDDFQAVASRAQVDLRADLDESLWVEGDPRRLAQAVSHLVGNAIKFTPGGGQVTVGCGRQDDAVRFWVQDSGIGFASDHKDRLFQPFSQLHDESRTRGGTGLGLYISKGIVEAHGGAIGIDSDGPERGATAWFTLPLMDVDEPEDTASVVHHAWQP